MKIKKTIFGIIVLAAVLLIAACSGESVYYTEPVEYYFAEDAPVEIEAEPALDIVLDNSETDTEAHDTILEALVQVKPWQDAYAALLREYAARSIGYSHDGTTPNPPGGFFMLFDIDADSVPELLVVDRFHFTTFVSAYTFTDAIVPLEAEYFYDYSTFFFALPGGRAGLGMESNEGVWNRAAILTIDGDKLVPEISLRRGEGSETDWQTWWRVNDEYVTEEEHDNLHDSLFGRWDEREQVPWHEITEDNIQNAIFGFEAP